MKRTRLMVALSVLLQACGTGAGTPSQEELLETWKAELMEADRAFSEAISQNGLSLWASFFTEDGAVIQEGAGEIRGTEAIQAAMDAAASAITSFSWTPERAEVSIGGDLGYTVGSWRTTAVDPDGVEMLRTGLYVSIWRRQEDGSWKVEMDLGNRTRSQRKLLRGLLKKMPPEAARDRYRHHLRHPLQPSSPGGRPKAPG